MKMRYFWAGFSFINLLLFAVSAETVYYSLENVMLDDGTQMTGILSWEYTGENFEDGTATFVFLEIPHTAHNQDDLNITIEPSQIEFSLEGNVDSDGVDITLVLMPPLAPGTSSLINTNTAESKYSIGGDGFNDGYFLSGSISPTNTSLSITPDASTFTVSWGPDLPGFVLQETPNLSSNWLNSASGSTNPVTILSSAPAMFYRAVKP